MSHSSWLKHKNLPLLRMSLKNHKYRRRNTYRNKIVTFYHKLCKCVYTFCKLNFLLYK